MDTHFDCLVIGAGYAGSVAAREMAERGGRRVLQRSAAARCLHGVGPPRPCALRWTADCVFIEHFHCCTESTGIFGGLGIPGELPL